MSELRARLQYSAPPAPQGASLAAVRCPPSAMRSLRPMDVGPVCRRGHRCCEPPRSRRPHSMARGDNDTMDLMDDEMAGGTLAEGGDEDAMMEGERATGRGTRRSTGRRSAARTSGGSRKSSGGSRKRSTGARKSTGGRSRKAAGGSRKTAAGSRKKTGGSRKKTGGSRKKTGGSRKSSSSRSSSSRSSSGSRKSSGRSSSSSRSRGGSRTSSSSSRSGSSRKRR